MAIKQTDERFLKQAKDEIETQNICLDCPFVIKLYGSYVKGKNFYIPIEYMNLGSLKTVINQAKTITEGLLGFITFQVLPIFLPNLADDQGDLFSAQQRNAYDYSQRHQVEQYSPKQQRRRQTRRFWN